MVLSQNEEFSIEGRRTDDKQSVRLHPCCCVAAAVQTGFWKRDAPSRRKFRKLHLQSHLTNDSSCIKCYYLQLDNSRPSLFHFSHIIRASSISCQQLLHSSSLASSRQWFHYSSLSFHCSRLELQGRSKWLCWHSVPVSLGCREWSENVGIGGLFSLHSRLFC